MKDFKVRWKCIFYNPRLDVGLCLLVDPSFTNHFTADLGRQRRLVMKAIQVLLTLWPIQKPTTATNTHTDHAWMLQNARPPCNRQTPCSFSWNLTYILCDRASCISLLHNLMQAILWKYGLLHLNIWITIISTNSALFSFASSCILYLILLPQIHKA